MSDFEDSNILADIHALEKALIIDIKDEQPQEHDYNDHVSDRFSSSDDEDNEDDYIYTNRDIDTDRKALNAYEINRRLIVGLTIAKKNVTVLLQECEQKIKQLNEEMRKRTDVSSLRIRYPSSTIGMPYFRDKNNFPAPKNGDIKLKESRGELLLLSLKKPLRWSEKDRDILLRAVHSEAIELILNFNSETDNVENPNIESNEDKKMLLPKSFNELVGALGEREFDWYKISVMDFDNKHSPEECRAMWNVYLHPEIRKTEWTSAEDKKLLRYAKQYQFQDWEIITWKLGTNRSAYQCFIRYNTIKKVPSIGRAWSKAEDKHLVRIINTLRIGDYIPWSEVASYLWYRTKQQIYARWVYRKAPHLKKGRFTSAETETLLKAMTKYGKDFGKISNAVMPNRTSVQLSERYYTLTKKTENIWTINDDMKLIELHKKYGNYWSKIATYFFRKTRTQVRHRFNALVRYTKKGMSIECIPRRYPASHKDTSIDGTSLLEYRNKNISIDGTSLLKYHDENILTFEIIPAIDITDIQLRLCETFCFPPSTGMINSEKLYEIGQLTYETTKLYNMLNLLGINLGGNIPNNSLNYIHIDRREKQLLNSLKEYINERNNKNNEMVENLRLEMFGNNRNVRENSFVPPIPFCGYTRKTRKVNNVTCCTDYVLNFNNKFLIETFTEFPENRAVEPFVSVEERYQFDKFSQLLTKYRDDYEKQNIHINKLLKYNFSFDVDCYTQYNIIQSNNLEEETTGHFNNDNKYTLSNVVLPNRTTLLGFKNLLLWKLLYEYENNKSDETSSLIENSEKSDQTATHSKQSDEYKRAYELLRTRLYQLFKFPICLSSTMLGICDSDTIFLSEKTDEQTSKKISRKRKNEDINPAQPDKRVKINILANSNFQQNTNVKTANLPMVRNSKTIRKKYKIITK